MNKIIAYSLFGDNPKYLIGALENVKGQKEFYPDWTCRFYIHKDVNKNIIRRLKKDAEVVIMKEVPVTSPLHWPGCWWRLHVLKDNTVDRFISRDTDSRLTYRERMIVKEWEESGLEFHIIRDHNSHGCKILTGMFGATKEFIQRIDYDKLVIEFERMNYNCLWSDDQEFLKLMIYPLIKSSSMIHDDRQTFRNEQSRKINYPKIDNHFIGETINV
jgi:hypothetical protein